MAVSCTTRDHLHGRRDRFRAVRHRGAAGQRRGRTQPSAPAGPFTFATHWPPAPPTASTVQTNPTGQTCTVASGSGTIASANITNVAISCTTATGGFQVQYQSTDANGVESYQVISANNGPAPRRMRVLRPTNPAPGVPHSFLYVLPVEAGLGNSFGDGLETLRALDAQDQYNLTIIEPSFGIDPWYADNPVNPAVQYDTFMTQELVPWVQKNLATTGSEQNWLIGFSKSGIGGQDLILRHPGVFTLAASWDFPADMSSYDQFGADSAEAYGTDANFQANYRLTTAFVDAHKGPFLGNNRMWIGGDWLYQTDMSDYDTLLTSEGIAHSTEPPQAMAHSWDSGWVPIALAALRQDSTNLPLAVGLISTFGVMSGLISRSYAGPWAGWCRWLPEGTQRVAERVERRDAAAVLVREPGRLPQCRGLVEERVEARDPLVRLRGQEIRGDHCEHVRGRDLTDAELVPRVPSEEGVRSGVMDRWAK